MSTQMRLAIAWTTVALVIGTVTPVQAAGPLPLADPQGPQRTGVIDEVNLGENYIIVNDRRYTLPTNVTIHGNRANRSALHKGMTVGIKEVAGPNGGGMVTEIWVQ